MGTTTQMGGAAVEAQLDEVERHGAALYERLRVTLERDHLGATVALHPDSGDYVVAEESPDAMQAMMERRPDGLMFIRRIGPPTPSDLRLAQRIAGTQLVYGK